MKIRLGDMRWPEIAEVLEKPNVVILPVASTEQHGRHLPVNFDAYSTTYIAEHVALKVIGENNVRVLVVPTIPYAETFGLPPFEKQLPGTITISANTTIRLIKEVVQSLVKQGFKNVLVLNGHFENIAPITVALREVAIDFKDAGLYATNWFSLAGEVWEKIRKGESGHAGERETAVALAIEPENVQCGIVYKASRKFSLPGKYILPLGHGPVFYHSRVGGVRDSGVHVNNPNVATKDAGEKYIASVLNELAEIIVCIAKSENMTHHEKG